MEAVHNAGSARPTQEEKGMTARNTIHAKLDQLRRQSRQTGQVRLPARALALGIRAGIHLLLAAVLAGAVIFQDSAPFGLALVAASGPGIRGAAALAGACFGSLTVLEFSPALRYSSACILTFAVSFAFYDWKPIRKPWTMPAAAGVLCAFTGLITQSRAGWTEADVIYFVLESLLAAGGAWVFRAALSPSGQGTPDKAASPLRRAGLLALLCACLISLAPLTLYRGISLGRLLAAAAVLTCGWQGGVAAGAVTGVSAGLAMDLTSSAMPLYAMALGLAGLTAGLCRGRPRPAAALAGVGSCAAAVLWTWDLGLDLSILYEAVLGSLVFCAIPVRQMRTLGAWLTPEGSVPADRQAKRLARQHLEGASQAFRSLGECLRTAFQPTENDSDISSVFDRTASRLCRGCTLRGRCWQRDYNATFTALNDATPAMVERGRAQAGDFPRYFADKCIHFSDFVSTVNEELTALFYRRQYNARIRESRTAVGRQYDQLSQLLGEAAAELSRELTPDPLGDRRARQRLAQLGVDAQAAVYRDGRGLTWVEIQGPGRGEMTRPSRLTELSQALGVPLRVEEEGEGLVCLLQQEPLMALAGVAAQKKNGETVSGDAGTYFKRSDGKLYLLLCDGMGSGPEANRESSLAVRLLEQLLQAGVPTSHALSTLSSALALRWEETGGFTTVDLLQIDLFTGEGELFKLGAAPTYVKKGGSVQRLSGSSLPAGLAEGDGSALDRFSLRLSPGDCVLMVSDGICGTGDDGWLKERLEQFSSADSPKDLARDLITHSPVDATDDRTALVVRIQKRPEE